MSLIDVINVDYKYEDYRGSLTQLVRRGFSQINVVVSNKGSFRGGHYHRFNTEAFFVIKGKCNVSACYEGEKEIKTFEQGDFFSIGPYVAHEFNYIEDTVMVTMYSLGVELVDGKMDIY